MYTQIALSPYRGFADNIVLPACGRWNILVGPNSSGKTSVMEALYRFGHAKTDFQEFEFSSPAFPEALRAALRLFPLNHSGRGAGSNPYWDTAELPDALRFEFHGAVSAHAGLVRDIMHAAPSPSWNDLWWGSMRGDTETQVKRAIDTALVELFERSRPHCHYFPSARSLRQPPGIPGINSAMTPQGLATRVRAIVESSDTSPLEELRRELRRFVPLFETHSLSVMSGNENILVVENRASHKRIPVPDLGDGIERLILLMAPLALDSLLRPPQSHLILLEEPENHFHPALWRALLRFFTERNDFQVFITTHSPSVVWSIPDARLYATSQAVSSELGGCTLRCASDEIRDLKLEVSVQRTTPFRPGTATGMIGHGGQNVAA